MSRLEMLTPQHSAIAPIDYGPADAVNPTEPQPYCDVWHCDVPTKLLSSSTNRGWSGLAAELRAHGKGVVPWRSTPSDIQVCVGIHGKIGSLITRRASGILDQAAAGRNTVWLSPAGWQEGSIEFADDLAEVVHIYLPYSRLSPSKLGIDSKGLPPGELKYEAAFEDSLISAMARAVASELKAETSAGRLMVESLANCMAVRLLQNYVRTPAAKSRTALPKGGLDRRRLLRVLDYIAANLEGDLTIDRMASIACLSRYHFGRAFRQAVGQSPHRYVSAKRLERAKAMLIQSDRPLVDIALSLKFSCQANFTRAFRQATGQAPSQYRQTVGARV